MIPILVYFNNRVNDTTSRVIVLETRSDRRYAERTDQFADFAANLHDLEVRMRALERTAEIEGPPIPTTTADNDNNHR